MNEGKGERAGMADLRLSEANCKKVVLRRTLDGEILRLFPKKREKVVLRKEFGEGILRLSVGN